MSSCILCFNDPCTCKAKVYIKEPDAYYRITKCSNDKTQVSRWVGKTYGYWLRMNRETSKEVIDRHIMSK